MADPIPLSPPTPTEGFHAGATAMGSSTCAYVFLAAVSEETVTVEVGVRLVTG